MTTSALDRAARDLCLADTDVQIHELSHDYPCPACVEEAKTAVFAALHDPDDPDWLARVLARRWWDRNTDDTDLWDDLTEAEQANVIANMNAADLADAVRAAILGADQ